MPTSPLLRNQRGIALLYLVILFTLLGVLVSAGIRKFGSTVTTGKLSDTKTELERDFHMITAWSVRNSHLPTFNEYSANIFGTRPQDSWGKPIGYVYNSSLTTALSGGLCGRTDITGQEVAFFLVSGSDDMNITSTTAITTSGSLTAALTNEDLYRIVTLKELRAQAGCDGPTQGNLRILNNELPKACKGIPYTASIFADGGVPPISFVCSGLPNGISNSGAALSGTTSVASGAYPVFITATDSQAPTTNSQQRKYFLNVTTCN